jgi:molybdopterin synthase catalytic subunit
MQVTVRWFGSLREAIGAKELALQLEEPARLSELCALVAERYPAVEAMRGRLRISLNQEIASGDPVLAEGDEVAFLPPVAGGAGEPPRRCTLSERPLDVGEVVARVSGPDAGGLVIFLGSVRNASRGHDIRHLEYEAYAGMAEREMDRIADEAAARWPGARVAMSHRSGHLAIGEIAVVVAAAAPHRAEAFAAARYAIDTLKERVPIWKKEVATDGEYWVEDHA